MPPRFAYTSGSGTQRPRPTLWDTATGGWSEDPVTAAWAAGACMLTFPACLSSHLWDRSVTLRVQAEQEAEELAARAGAAVGPDGLTGLIAATTAPLDRASSIAMWGAIALIAIAVVIVVLAGLWVTRGFL